MKLCPDCQGAGTYLKWANVDWIAEAHRDDRILGMYIRWKCETCDGEDRLNELMKNRLPHTTVLRKEATG